MYVYSVPHRVNRCTHIHQYTIFCSASAPMHMYVVRTCILCTYIIMFNTEVTTSNNESTEYQYTCTDVCMFICIHPSQSIPSNTDIKLTSTSSSSKGLVMCCQSKSSSMVLFFSLHETAHEVGLSAGPS